MHLKDIINTNDAVAALTGLEEFEPIQIHLNGKNKYADLVDKLEEYLKNPDIVEMHMFLKKYKFEKEFSKPDFLRIVLRANNFHLLTKFQFETTKDLIDVILKIEKTLLFQTESFKFFNDYFKFSIQMSLKHPIISNLPKAEEKEEVNARDNGPDDDPVLKFDTKSSGQFSSRTPIKSPLVRSLSQPTSEESSVKRTKRTSGSPLKSEHRDNALKSYIGLLYPDSEVIDFPVNEFSDLKLKTIPSEGISRRLQFEVPSTYNEMDVQIAAQKNIFGIPSIYILSDTLTGGTRSITINENKLETRPDLEIKLEKGLIPIEIKKDSIQKNLDYFYGKTSIRKRINFLEIYSQGVREALCCGINCFFLSDYTTTLFVEFDTVGGFQEIEGCTITRPLVGRIIHIEETKDSEYSANFHLFLLLKKLQNEYIQRSEILANLQNNGLYFTTNSRNIIVKLFNTTIEKYYNVLFNQKKSLSIPIPKQKGTLPRNILPRNILPRNILSSANIPIATSHYDSVTSNNLTSVKNEPINVVNDSIPFHDSSATSNDLTSANYESTNVVPGSTLAMNSNFPSTFSAGSHYSYGPMIDEFALSTDPDRLFSANPFSKVYTEVAERLTKGKICQHMSMRSIHSEYNIISFINGTEFNTTVSIVIEIQHIRTKVSYILKVIDPIRSSIFTTKQSILRASYQRCLKLFYNEVQALLRLKEQV